MKARTRKPETILPPYLPVEKIQEEIFNGTQSIQFLGIYKLTDAVQFEGKTIKGLKSAKVRIHIERDSYDSQSHAKIESWTGTGWAYITSIPWAMTESKDIFYQTKANEIDYDSDGHRFSIDAESLLGLAAKILF